LTNINIERFFRRYFCRIKEKKGGYREEKSSLKKYISLPITGKTQFQPPKKRRVRARKSMLFFRTPLRKWGISKNFINKSKKSINCFETKSKINLKKA